MTRRTFIGLAAFIFASVLTVLFFDFFQHNWNYFLHGHCGNGKGCFNRVIALFVIIAPALSFTFFADYMLFPGRPARQLFVFSILPALLSILLLRVQKSYLDEPDLAFFLLPAGFACVWFITGCAMRVINPNIKSWKK